MCLGRPLPARPRARLSLDPSLGPHVALTLASLAAVASLFATTNGFKTKLIIQFRVCVSQIERSLAAEERKRVAATASAAESQPADAKLTDRDNSKTDDAAQDQSCATQSADVEINAPTILPSAAADQT